MIRKNTFAVKSVFLLAAASLIGVMSLGGASGCGSGASSDATSRTYSGSISSSELSGLTLNGKTQALSCSNLKIVCSSYTGEDVEVSVDDDCTFSLDLPLDSFCFCGVFTEDDEYLASVGCQEDGSFQGAIPVFAGPDGETDEIDLGDDLTISDFEITANALCEEVDQDGDGESDAEDSDDDGDGTSDSEDDFNEFGFEDAEDFDSDGDNIPDIFEDLWADLADEDDDGIPNFCDDDADGDGEDNDEDSDDDGDGLEDDADEDDLGDGVDDDEDEDEDGIADDEENDSCESSECSNDFQCQLFADDDLTDEFETDNVQCVEGCCELIE